MMNYYAKVLENLINFLMMYLIVFEVEMVEVNELFHFVDDNFHSDLIPIAKLFVAILFVL
jgi:hypothetical protein